jgi:hypothetical protein
MKLLNVHLLYGYYSIDGSPGCCTSSQSLSGKICGITLWHGTQKIHTKRRHLKMSILLGKITPILREIWVKKAELQYADLVKGSYFPVRYVPKCFVPIRYVPVYYFPRFWCPLTFHPWNSRGAWNSGSLIVTPPYVLSPKEKSAFSNLCSTIFFGVKLINN